MGVQYEEGMAVYIRDGVAVDPWGREVEGFDVEGSQKAAEAAQQPAEDDQYDEMSAQELKDELRRRQDAGREIDTTGVTRKAQLAQKLREDDKAQAAQG
jgi:hypothetical protein